MCANPHETISYRLMTELWSGSEANVTDHLDNTFSLYFDDTKANFTAESGDWIETNSNEIRASYVLPTDQADRSPSDTGYSYQGSGEGSGETAGAISQYSMHESTQYDRNSKLEPVFFKIETRCQVIGLIR